MDLEASIGRVWNADVRLLVNEAVRCYSSGAVRAAIAATWTAVVADVLGKVSHLADDGEPVAQALQRDVDQAQGHGLNRDGVRAMQAIEDQLLKAALELELIDSIGQRDLERIRQDRNLCVHPSLRQHGETYHPEPEVARAHLAVALSTLLLHAPIQGKRVQESFTRYICDPTFSPATAHLQATYFDRVRTGTRKRIVAIAAKHALRELDPPTDVAVPAHVIADRMATTLKAFAERDRGIVRGALSSQMGQFATAEGAVQLRAMARLGDRDYFWDAIDDSVRDRLRALIEQPEPRSAEHIKGIALAGATVARDHLPQLGDVFAALSLHETIEAIAASPAAYFVPAVIDAVKRAPNWSTGTDLANRVLVQHARYFTPSQLKDLLLAWMGNDQCRLAFGMPEAAARMAALTTATSPDTLQHWTEFLTMARIREPDEGYYSYRELALEI